MTDFGPKPDFTLENHGSIMLLRPLTGAAQDWVDDHIPDEAMAWGDAIAIEPRYIEDIADGIIDDGLSIT